jgi:hypothetical protein
MIIFTCWTLLFIFLIGLLQYWAYTELIESTDNKNWMIIIDKQNIDNIYELFTKVRKNKMTFILSKSRKLLTSTKTQ